MQEYYQLQNTLYRWTLIFTVLFFGAVWFFYSLNIALNYLLGATVGFIYLRLLAREVETLGTSNQRAGAKGLGLFALLIILASRWQELHIVPVFLGFLTYKAAIIAYTVQSVLTPPQNSQ
ncbi:MAG: hypothetical protein N5P05_003832 [Chroococcopsis gigantea SAG 12.99]|jgi:ATP synthase protein I|nr:ATP synthase subunit I [Chlorogloea purpurea SAG 13.99]MDV3002226.1 hypothetical protein [Chroococcopsis gigantea SAG 12.99]